MTAGTREGCKAKENLQNEVSTSESAVSSSKDPLSGVNMGGIGFYFIINIIIIVVVIIIIFCLQST